MIWCFVFCGLFRTLLQITNVDLPSNRCSLGIRVPPWDIVADVTKIPATCSCTRHARCLENVPF